MIDIVKRRASTQTLLQFPDLAALSAPSLQRLADRSTVEELPAGRLLFKPGVRDSEDLYLLSGEIALVSDNRAVGNVVAGTPAATQALAPERPRRLWGWTRSKIQVLCVDSQTASQVREQPQPPAEEPSAVQSASSSSDSRLVELQRAQQMAEQERDHARSELATVREQCETLQRELRVAQERIKDLESAKATSACNDEQAASASAKQHAAEPTAPTRPLTQERDSNSETLQVPSLKMHPNERGVLAPAEIDDLLQFTSIGVHADQRGSHQG